MAIMYILCFLFIYKLTRGEVSSSNGALELHCSLASRNCEALFPECDCHTTVGRGRWREMDHGVTKVITLNGEFESEGAKWFLPLSDHQQLVLARWQVLQVVGTFTCQSSDASYYITISHVYIISIAAHTCTIYMSSLFHMQSILPFSTPKLIINIIFVGEH